MPNTQNFSAFTIQLKALRKKKLKTKQRIKEKNKVEAGIADIALGYLTNSKRKAPIARGINIRNENLTAFSLSIPKNNPVEIVIPLLETPGSKAIACIKPILKTFPELSFLLEKL